MSKKYQHILSPVMTPGGVLLKSRLICANSLPHFLQGPESFPADPVISYLSNVAKNGAAIVTVADWTNPHQHEGDMDGSRFPMWDRTDPSMQNYLAQLADAVHFWGSKITVSFQMHIPDGYNVSAYAEPKIPAGQPNPNNREKAEEIEAMRTLLGYRNSGGMMPPRQWGPQKALTREMMQGFIDELIDKLYIYRNAGFDGVTLHAAYNSTLLAAFLTPLTNQRTDEYGGSMENRARFPLEMCQAVKDTYGERFIVELQMSGEEEAGGLTIEDTVSFAKLAEGKVDILQLRAADGDISHPTCFNSQRHRPITLQYARAVKAGGANILVEPIGGYQDLDDMEQYLAEGQTDLIGLARAFICDSEYGRWIEEGRGEDVRPCIRCNRCHGLSIIGPWLSVCSVNPRLGLEHRLRDMVRPPDRVKRVAILGGGPAGMQCAITAADRGHQVVLYEKDAVLGGQLRHADFAPLKWPIYDFKEYLIRQVEKRAVQVCLSSSPSPESLRREGFDAVICAMGSSPSMPEIDGTHTSGALLAAEIYGREGEVGQRVVVIGGAEVGTETAMYLAGTGREVTLLTRQGVVAPDAHRVHYYTSMQTAWEALETLTICKRAVTTAVEPGAVTYIDRWGERRRVTCDTVVVAGGSTPRLAEAMAYADVAGFYAVIGDNEQVGNIQKAIRAGFGAANRL